MTEKKIIKEIEHFLLALRHIDRYNDVEDLFLLQDRINDMLKSIGSRCRVVRERFGFKIIRPRKHEPNNILL